MALPSTAITRFELSATFEEFSLAMNRQKFIAPQVFRPRIVGVQAADAGKIELESLLQTPDDHVSPKGGYQRGDFEWTTWQYATEERGREEPINDRRLRMFRDVLDAEAIHTQRAMDIVLRNYEIDAADALYDTDTWTGAALTTGITHEWDDATNAVPMDDIKSAKDKVRDGCGLEANALVCNSDQFWNLMHTDQVVDLLKYWGGDDPKKLNLAVAAALFELDHIIVAGGLKNSANEGQSASVAKIWSDEYAMVCRVAETDDPAEPCIGRTFMWADDGPGATGTEEELALVVEEYREEGVRGSVLRARNDRVIKVMYAQAGHLLSNVYTA